MHKGCAAVRLEAWLKRERKTQGWLAEQVGCTQSHISRLVPRPGKKQMRRPSLDLAARIRCVTGGEVTEWDLSSDSDEFGCAA